MPTNVRTDNKDLLTQFARGTVFQKADPVFMNPKGDPGPAPYFNTSTTIHNAAGTVFNKNTKVATKDSYMGAGRHPIIVIAGRITLQVHGDGGLTSWMKNVFIERRNAVMHGVRTSVNALWSMLPPAVKTAVQNGAQIAQGMTLKDFGDAAKEDAAAMMDALMSTDTLIALAQTAALMGLSLVPVVGQLAGGAAAVQRLTAAVKSVDGAAAELKEMMERWTKPMSPAQIAAERKKLASFLIRVGIAAILAALGKAAGKISARSTGKANSSKEVEVGKKDAPRQTSCLCATGSPVIIATGEKTLADSDFALPGPIALDWIRSYRSGDAHCGWFGQGWSAPLAVQLSLTADALTYHDAGGRDIRLPALPIGSEYFDAYEQLTLHHPTTDRWDITAKDGRTEHFERARDDLFALPLAAISDRNGNRIKFTYPEVPDDPFAPRRPQTIIDSAGRHLRLAWNHRGLLTSVVMEGTSDAPSLTLATYVYNDENDLIAHSNAIGARRSYEWRNNMLVAYTKADGARYCAEYDEYSPFGRVLHSYSAVDGHGLNFEYDERARSTSVTDALGRTTRYEYDERKDIVASTGPDGTRVETPFDANGNLRGSADPLGRQTQYRFDRRGNLAQLVDATGARSAIEYNAMDLPVKFTDALNHAWLREYDARGNLTLVVDPLGRLTRYANDSRGQVVDITDHRGGMKRLQWDSAGNMTSHSDCSGQSTHFTYDSLGRLLARTDALGHVTRYRWNAVGHLQEMEEPGGSRHQYEWSAQGRLLTYTNPSGAVTRYRYDSQGKPVARINANGHTLQYVYDVVGRLTRLINENGDSTRFAYDLADHLTDEIGFDGRHQRYCFNAAGELTHLVEAGGGNFGPGKVTRFERDMLGRLVSKRAEDDVSCHASYHYDALGRLTDARNPAAEVAFAYDPVGQVLSETQTLKSGQDAKHTRVVKHAYDVLGNRTESILPDQRTLHWLFYGSGHLHQINLEQAGQHRLVADIERDDLHREVGRSQGALASRYEYDPMGRLTRHQLNRTTPLYGHDAAVGIGRSYHYDAAGNLSAQVDLLRGRQTYRYDPVGRILAAGGRQEELFGFDPAGNMRQFEQDRFGGDVSVNRLRVFQDLRYDYDMHGNVATRDRGAHEQVRLCWNADHQLCESIVTRHGVTQTTRYEYDALGRRTRKSDAFGHTDYLWDGDLMIQSQRGNKAALFVFEPNSFVPLATIQDDETFWYHCDQIGTPQELTDREGDVVWAADYRVWGEARLRKNGTDNRGITNRTFEPRSSPLEQPFRFQGQQFDEETGLHYNRFRYYDAAIGRFASQDPVGLTGGTNLYEYAPNPTSWIDPLGLTPCLNRRQALNKAKDLAGIPRSQQIKTQWEVGNDVTRRGMKNYKYSENPTHYGRFYEYVDAQGHAKVVVEHTADPCGPHAHAGRAKGEDPRNYDFKQNPYQKIDDPRTQDHHIHYGE